MNNLSFFSFKNYSTITFHLFKDSVKVAELPATKNNDSVWIAPFPINSEIGEYTSIAVSNFTSLGQELVYWTGSMLLNEAEIIASKITQSQSALTIEQSKQLAELYIIFGLDSTKPLTVTKTKRMAGDIDQNIVDTTTQTTITRI